MTDRNKPGRPSLEVWGGVEYSFVRLENRVEDELTRTGHIFRISDLDRFAELGLRALRYPVIWDRHASEDPDWSWADERLHRLRDLGIRPIVGFVHHGCGPLPGGMLDPGFVDGLARFADKVARRYPWIDAYTPVNEPLTTARFSGLYGLWHPHGRDVACFARVFINQCLAVRAAMRAVRKHNPRAQLIQTEDVGKTHSTPRLAYQAELENERRWLTFDLLCGRIDRDHPLRSYLKCGDVTDAELDSFVSDPCPPDLLGMNHYVTSERFLDERLRHYPPATHGGNEVHSYADVTAVRVRAEGLVGPHGLLHELWDRFRRPIAITEVQLACTREEQLRWVMDFWHDALAAQSQGVDVRAFTAWSLLGAYDWDSLLVESNGNYESGAFDLRAPEPRPTVTAKALQSLAKTGRFYHPVLDTKGWWKRNVRYEYPPVSAPRTGRGNAVDENAETHPNARPILITGAGGTLGRAFVRLCHLRGLPAVALTRQDLDLTDSSAVLRALTHHSPWAVINASGYVRVDDAEHDQRNCHLHNVVGAVHLAEACGEYGIKLATFSTDLVFDGNTERPYTENDPTRPLNVYGQSKQEAEKRVLRLNPNALVVRTSAFFGPWDEVNFVSMTLNQLRDNQTLRVADDMVVSPTYVPDLVNATLDLVIDDESGLWHLSNAGLVTWHDWAKKIAERAGWPADRVQGVPVAELGLAAARPRFCALGSERGVLLRPWEDALDRYFSDREKPVPQLFVDPAPDR